MVKNPTSNEDYIALSPVYIPRHNLTSRSSSELSIDSSLLEEEKTSTRIKPPPIITDLSPTFNNIDSSPSIDDDLPRFLSPLQFHLDTDVVPNTLVTPSFIKTPEPNKSSWSKRIDRDQRFILLAKQIPIEYIDNNLMYLDNLVASIKMVLGNIASIIKCISSILITQLSQSPIIKDYFRYIVKRMCELKHFFAYYGEKSGQLDDIHSVTTNISCIQLDTLQYTFNKIHEEVEEEWLSENEALLQKKKKD